MKEIKFHIHSLGCAKNQVDSEIMITSLCKKGYTYTETPDTADIVIINSCGFIESAKEESIVATLEMKARFPEKKIILAGCLTERYKEVLQKELPEIDGFIGNRDPGDIGTKIESLMNSEEYFKEPDKGKGKKQLKRTFFLSYPGSAFVKISEGCNNRCTYCTIPAIRGRLKSRPVGEIVDEITGLLSLGIKEITLVAQDTGSFGLDLKKKTDIITLLAAISRIDCKFWLRLLYIHPDRFPEKILEIFKKNPGFLPYFDIPFQHASPRILHMMGRKGNPDAYFRLIKTIRSTIPGAIIRSTFLTGFPGETDEDFRILTNFQHNAALDWLGVFTYSREEGTPAYNFPGRIKKTVAQKRKKIIESNQISITNKQLSRFVGKDMDVLVEEPVKNENLFIGRAYLHAPEVDGLVVINGTGLVPGSIVRTRIVRRNNFDLEAVLL